jgi:septal ring factor EnvC (AmiA/AmiB activator)
VADNKELIDLLRTVIKEELQPIRKEIAQEFKQVTGRLDCLENGQKQLQKDAKNIKTELHAVWEDVSRFEKRISTIERKIAQ